VQNGEVAAILEEYAALLELAGAGRYSARAYRRAGRARELRGIGPGIETRLIELADRGEIAELEQLRQTTSPELAALGRLYGFGAQLGSQIAVTLGIRTESELRAAAAAGRLREVPGIGPRTETKIRAALEGMPGPTTRPLLLTAARALSDRIAEAVGGIVAGDPRRWADEPRRLAVVVGSEDAADVRSRFAAVDDIVLVEGDVGLTRDGVPVELVVSPPGELGTALLRATGPSKYVESLSPLPLASEERAVYRLLGLPYLEPELREAPPQEPIALIELEDVCGDLHCHTVWSDGKATVLELATAARDRGYDYLAICDHTRSVRVVPGLDGDDLKRQALEIAAANEQLSPFRILRGSECDICADGSLDLPDDVLADLEWVQLSLHAGQRTPRRELTARVTEAMRHPAVRCLSHPTGRIIGHRPENALDLEATIETALETSVALEVNGLPSRLDLRSEHVRVAVEAGVAIVCSTDAHSVAGLDNMALAVHTARRGHARAADVLNTRQIESLLNR
jgi:DNA polymerase (family 10)